MLMLAASLMLTAACPADAGSLLKPRDSAPAILPVNDAFQLQPVLWRDSKLDISLDIAPGCYLYRDKIQVEVLEPTGLKLGRVALPPGEVHQDEHFGVVRVFRQQLAVQHRVDHPPQRLRIRYQGCAEGLVCYPPQVREVTVESLR